jgi:hypothetical protein
MRVPEDARWNIAAAANGDHEVGLELIEDLVCCLLAQLVDLCRVKLSAILCIISLLGFAQGRLEAPSRIHGDVGRVSRTVAALATWRRY